MSLEDAVGVMIANPRRACSLPHSYVFICLLAGAKNNDILSPSSQKSAVANEDEAIALGLVDPPTEDPTN